MIIKDQSSAVWNYYEASTDDGASSSRMSHLQQDHDNRPPSPPPQAHSTPSPPRRRLGLTALASTIFTVVMSAGLATFFLLFIMLSQVHTVTDPAAFVVRERVLSSSTLESSSLSALAISTAISHFLGITIPVLFSLLAYRTAYLWLQAQSSPSANEESAASRLPTPLHYGLLVRILNSSTILNLGPLAAYFMSRPGRQISAPNTTAISTPRLLREAFAAAFLIYFLSHAVGLADIWLHSVSSVGIARAVTPASSLPNFSMVFNHSLCDPSTGLQCLSSSDHWGTPSVVRAGTLVAANSTNPTEISVISLAAANDTAILVPTDFIREWNFSASTYGARAQCYQISSYCADYGCTSDGTNGPAVDAGMSLLALEIPKTSSKFSTRSPGFKDYRDRSRVMAYVGNMTVGSVTGMPASVSSAIPPNPGPLLIKLRWTDYESSAPSVGFLSSDSNPLVYTDTIQGKEDGDEFQTRSVSTLYAQCELEFVRVRYGYSQDSQFVAYNIRGMNADAAVFWSPLIWQEITAQFESNVHQACLTETTVDGTLAMIRQEISRLAIAGAAGMVERTTEFVGDASTVTQLLVGRYPRIPVFVFAGLLYAYAALAIVLFLSTAACTSEVIVPEGGRENEKLGVHGEQYFRTYTALELAQLRLIDPTTLIAEQQVWAPHSLPPQASAMSMRTRTAEMFGINQPVGEGKAAPIPDRLVVGLGGPFADAGNPRFGVWRRPKRRSELEHETPSIGYGRAVPSSVGTGEMVEGTTLVGSMTQQQGYEMMGMPPAYSPLARMARSRSDGSDYAQEYLVQHAPRLVNTQRQAPGVRIDLNAPHERRPIPQKDLSELMRIRSSVSSEGSEASTSSERTVRRSTGV